MRLAATVTVPLLLALACGGATSTSSTTTGGGGSSPGTGGTSSNAGSGGIPVNTGVGGSSMVACGKSVCVGGQVCCNPSCGICTDPESDCAAIACVDPPPLGVDCNMVAKAPLVGSCMQLIGGPDAGIPGPEGVDLTVKGKVVSFQSGVPAGGCMQRVLQFEANAPALAMATQSLVVSDGNQSWDVEYLIPGAKVPNLTGQLVGVTYRFRFGGFGPTLRRLTITSESGMTIYQGDAGDIQQLIEPPLPFTRGASICATHDMCGDWSRYDLNVNPGPAQATVTHGGSAQVGNAFVVHGGYAEQSSPGTSCPDWFVADVHVGVVKTQ